MTAVVAAADHISISRSMYWVSGEMACYATANVAKNVRRMPKRLG